MVELFALFLGMGLTAWAGWLVVARGKRQLDSAIAYRQVARTLGFEVDTRGVSLAGHLEDRRLWVGEVLVGHGRDRHTAIWGVVDLRRPLGIGLNVRRRGLSERVFRRGRGPGIELGNELDAWFEATGDQHARVRALLGAPDVRAALRELRAVQRDIVLTDASVLVHLDRPLTRERELDQLVERMLGLASALERSREQLPPAPALEPLVSRWRAVAEARGMRFEPWLPAIADTIDGHRVVIGVRRMDDGYEASLRLYFAAHRPAGLRLCPQRGPDGYWSVGQDIQIGDPAFDRAFVVKGWDPDRIRALLDPAARDALTALTTCGELEVDDARMLVAGIPLDAGAVDTSIERALAAARALKW